MSGNEVHLLARAKELDDTSDLAGQVIDTLRRGRAAGLETRNALGGLIRAALSLDGGQLAIWWAKGEAFARERDLIDAVCGVEDAIAEWLTAARRTHAQVLAALTAATEALDAARAALAAAQAQLAAAQSQLAAAHAMPAGSNDEAGAKAAATAAAEAAVTAAGAAVASAQAAIADAERRIGMCQAALVILGPLTDRLRLALGHIRRVPQDLGEFYEHWYEHIRLGRKVPDDTRFFTGEEAL